MRSLVLAAGLIALLGILGACAAGPAATPTRVSHLATLAGTAWRLVAIDGRAIPAGSDVTLAFTPSEASGNGGCNAFGGAYTYDPATGGLSFGSLVSTKRACVEPARNDVEAAYLNALRTVRGSDVDPDGRLVLTGGGPELLFEVGAQPAR